jgi:hypothetical protein
MIARPTPECCFLGTHLPIARDKTGSMIHHASHVRRFIGPLEMFVLTS